MKVGEVMTARIEACDPGTDLGAAAMIMWRNDCGIVPVTEPGSARLRGVLTDRDICMALATTGRPPSERTVSEIMSTAVVSVDPEAEVSQALEAMSRDRVRRLPVVDGQGTLVGMLSMNDLILRAQKTARGKASITFDEVMRALQAISEHRDEQAPRPATPRKRATRAVKTEEPSYSEAGVEG
jgi:CBS domain-containing protein